MPAALRHLPEPLVAAAAMALLVLLAYLLPGAESGFARTPASILFGGVIDGTVVSLATVALVLVYSSVRVINFAQVAVGIAGAVLCFDLIQLSGVPFLLAFPIGLGMGLACGALFHLVFGTRFARAPRVVLTLVTVFAGSALSETAGGLISQLPFLPTPNLRPLDQVSGVLKVRPDLPFPHWSFSFSSYPQPFGFPELFALGTSIVALAAIAVFLRSTRVGKAIRAAAENSERASLLGISVGLMSLIVWTLSGGLSALVAMLEGFEYQPNAVFQAGPAALLIPLTAAVLAKMRSLWTAVALSIGLTVASEAIGFQNAALRSLFDLGLFGLLIGGLLLRGRSLSRLAEEASSWNSAADIRPVPREMSGLVLLRVVKWAAVAIGFIAVALAPVVLSIGAIQELGVIMLTAVIALSVVILTGWAGQVSFGQYAIAGVGSIVAAWLSSKVGLTPWLAIPIATAAAVAVGCLMAFPALRIRGLFLVAVTFVFAIVARSLLFDPNYLGWLQPGIVKRPALFILDFSDERWMYGLAAGTLVAAIVVTRNLRKSRFGRLVIAGRDNEASLEASGISGVRMKLAAFAAAGALAGLGGALLAYEQFGVSANSYDPTQSLIVFQMVVVGGVASAWGGLLGVAVIYGLNFLGQQVPGVAAFLPVVPLFILYVTPTGLLGAGARTRDAILRIIAHRSQLVVPSLYADVAPEALEMRLIPLAPPAPEGFATGFQILSSRLSGVGARAAAALTRSREAAAIGAAALAASGTEEPAVEPTA